MPMTKWKMKQLTELSDTDEEYMRMYEAKETIGQVMADREHLRRIIVDKNRSLITLQTLVKNQTTGGAAQVEIIENMRAERDTCNEKRGWLERELNVFTGVTSDLRKRLKISQQLVEDRQKEVDTRQRHVDDLGLRLRRQESYTKSWHAQVVSLKINLTEVTEERDMIIKLSNESLDKLHDIEALVR